MKISVIVPAFNEEKLIAATLEVNKTAMSAFTERGWETELIVCDNNSTDRTGEIARAAGAKVVFEPINQIAGARNRAASEATGDWFVVIDADTYPTKELFGAVADAAQSGKYIYAGSTFKLDGNYPIASKIALFWNGLSRMMKFAGGPFICAEASAFRQIGGFDTKLFASEDIDFSQRMKRYGRKVKKRGIILTQHPLVISARKIHLYTPGEHLWFLARACVFKKRTLQDPEACHIWYDGRR
jgi:glycosyltransferase involved in cell wall biosynthesis